MHKGAHASFTFQIFRESKQGVLKDCSVVKMVNQISVEIIRCAINPLRTIGLHYGTCLEYV